MRYAVMGASGHVGGAVVRALRDRGEDVVAIVHDPAKGEPLERIGARIAVADVDDADGLAAALAMGERAFLLNPPAPIDGDTNARELETGRAIAAAVRQARPDKVVVSSVISAREGEGIGDLSTLYALEQAVLATGVPTAIDRAGYYYSNFDLLLDEARGGRITTMFPADFRLAMVDPEDLGRVAARRLTSGLDDVGIVDVEGPEHLSFADVSAAFADALGRDVAVNALPREEWHDAYRGLGFSDEAARAYGRMTEATIDGARPPETIERGSATLPDYIARLVERGG